MLRFSQKMRTCQGLALLQHLKGASTSGFFTPKFHKKHFASAPPPPPGSLEPLMSSEAMEKYSDEMVERWIKNQESNSMALTFFKLFLANF